MRLQPIHELELRESMLERVELSWNEGEARLFLRKGEQTFVLCGRNVKLLRCSRALRWGESARVYEVRQRGAGVGLRLELELQSGDVMELEADELGAEPTR